MAKIRGKRRPASTVLSRRRHDRCTDCSGKLRWRAATAPRPHPFPDYGFPLKVSGISVATCRACGTAHAAVGPIERFENAVLEPILQSPAALTGEEILFIRRRLGWTGGTFAGLVGVSREHVSHIEQGHTPDLGTSADRLARLVVAARRDPSLRMLRRVLGALDEDIGTRAARRPARRRGYHVRLGARR